MKMISERRRLCCPDLRLGPENAWGSERGHGCGEDLPCVKAISDRQYQDTIAIGVGTYAPLTIPPLSCASPPTQNRDDRPVVPTRAMGLPSMIVQACPGRTQLSFTFVVPEAIESEVKRTLRSLPDKKQAPFWASRGMGKAQSPRGKIKLRRFRPRAVLVHFQSQAESRNRCGRGSFVTSSLVNS